jgi:hypothetical protein
LQSVHEDESVTLYSEPVKSFNANPTAANDDLRYVRQILHKQTVRNVRILPYGTLGERSVYRTYENWQQERRGIHAGTGPM